MENPDPGVNERDIEFLYEVGCLRFIDRAWKQFLNLDGANLAEHTLRVVWIASLIAKYERADVNKIIKMALVHDLGESRTGDAHYVSDLYTTRDEKKAINDIFNKTVLSDEFIDLWKEYDARDSLEAKIVKDADNLDVELEIQEQIVKDGLKRERVEIIRNFILRQVRYCARKLIPQIQMIGILRE